MSWNIKTPGDYINGPLTVAGSATITGAATVQTLGVTGASTLTGSVGIGAASSAKLSVFDTNGIPLRFGDIAAAPVSQLACYVGISTSGLPGSGNGDLILVPRTSDARDVVIYTGSGTAADRLRVTAAGNVNITTGNVVMSTSGKGIDFSAKTPDGSGTVGSEILNDYEEGTWDAAFISTTGTVTINTGSNRCRYTKIGRLVTVQGFIEVTSVSSPTGNLIISGLPFTIATVTEGDTYSAASICADALEVTAIGQIVGFGSPNSTYIYLYRYQAGVLIGLAPSAKAGSQFFFTLTYSV